MCSGSNVWWCVHDTCIRDATVCRFLFLSCHPAVDFAPGWFASRKSPWNRCWRRGGGWDGFGWIAGGEGRRRGWREVVRQGLVQGEVKKGVCLVWIAGGGEERGYANHHYLLTPYSTPTRHPNSPPPSPQHPPHLSANATSAGTLKLAQNILFAGATSLTS